MQRYSLPLSPEGTIQSIWCTGLPGAGKTFVFSTIVDYITSKEGRGHWKADLKIGVAYIYCSYNDQRAQTLDAVLSSVIQQLISLCPTPSQTSDPLLKRALAFQEYHKRHSPATSDYIQLLKDVVVDHSGSNTRATLISVLLNLPIQLLVTSRQLESIRDLFPSTLELPIRPDRRDIQSYIKWRISDPVYGSRKLLRLTESHESLQDHIINEILLKYSQIFNLVRLQMDHIRDLSTVGELRAALSALPMREEDFYGQSIMRIRDNSAQRERAMNVLSWVLRARRPMKLHEIIHAVAILPDRSSVTSNLNFVPPLEDLVDSCEGLALINHESETMTFAYPTIEGYLETTSHSSFDIDPEITISQACLTYLLFEEMKDLTTRSIFDNESSKYPLLDYSSTHWSTHVHRKPEQVYIEIIMRLLHQHSRSGSVLPGLRDPDYEDLLWYD
ncbi:hypothetical protein DL98DRAFT_542683 [Cadophora sp. DSE1049]|nr:hypothetical protein DL98DRAFT_542683 [Cadophora sp. DSE1049]